MKLWLLNWTKAGMPAEPITLLSLPNELGKFWNTSDHGAMTALQTTKVSLCEYADNIALTAHTAHHLQHQLDRFHTYTALKGLCTKPKPWPSVAPTHQCFVTMALLLRIQKNARI